MKLFDQVTWSSSLLGLVLGFSLPSFGVQPTATPLPLAFEQNRGQSPDEVQYVIRRGSLEGEFLKDGVRLKLSDGAKDAPPVTMRMIGAQINPRIVGGRPLEGQSNYLIGDDPAKWLRGIPNYSEVRYDQIYPGTNLVFYANSGMLEHDFEVQPGADPTRIGFQIDGATKVALVDQGDLRIELPSGVMTFKRPTAYQVVAGVRHVVNAAFTTDRKGVVRFRLGSYDPTRELVIDPVLSFATYLSSLSPVAEFIATDGSGNNYISGYASIRFPVTKGAFAGCTGCTTGNTVVFISKLSADGTKLLYSTVVGGNSFAQPTGISVDGSGNVLVSGFTGATDFPTKNGQSIGPPNNAYSGFLVSLSADGSSLNYGTMLGSPPSVSPVATTYATAVTVDSSGNAYVTGETGDGFFTTAGALNKAVISNSRNSFDVFLAKFSPTGSLIYSAVLGTADPQNGGAGPIGSSAIAVDSAGNAFVAGQAGSLWPISKEASLKEIGGSMPYANPFVTKVAPDAKSIVYSTYLDYAYVISGIRVLSDGSVFVTGDGVGASYPTTPGAYQQNSGGGGAFLSELNSSGSSLVYSTVIGDSTYSINGMDLDPDGDIWLAARTSNPQFPLVKPIQSTFPSPNLDEPVSVLNQFDPTGKILKFSTFLGGNAYGYANSVAVDSKHKAHVSGAAGYGMYTTPGVYVTSVPSPGAGYTGATYAYVAVVDPVPASGTVCLSESAGAGLSFGYLIPGTALTQSLQVSNCGSGPLTFSSITSSNGAFTVPSNSDGCTGLLAVGKSCTVSVKFAPSAAQAHTGQLAIKSSASIETTSISLSGFGAEPNAYFEYSGVFEPLLVGQTSPASFFILQNSSQVPLRINLAKVTVSGNFALAPGGDCPSSLAGDPHAPSW